MRRAEALLQRHRGAAGPVPPAAPDVPLLTDAVELEPEAPRNREPQTSAPGETRAPDEESILEQNAAATPARSPEATSIQEAEPVLKPDPEAPILENPPSPLTDA